MKDRILSAILALLIVIPVLLVGGFIFELFVIIIGVIGFKELINIREPNRKLPLIIKFLAYLVFLFLVSNLTDFRGLLYTIDYRVAAFAVLSLFMPLVLYHDEDKYNFEDALFLMASVMLLGISFRLFVVLREYSLINLIYLVLITTMGDTYAFISGKLIGNHKLIESISPKKTVEGIIFGTLFAVLISSTFYYIYIDDTINILILLGLSTILSLAGSLGDLVFSSIKRHYNKKDFSNFMPGHGGILDRLDSIIFVMLTYILFISMF